jgi:transcription antitermination factor NusG
MRTDGTEHIENVTRERAVAWYALHTRHQHEKSAATTLANRGFEVFLPLRSAEHQWKDRKKTVSLPLFPCYLFLRGGIERKLDLLSAPGVLSLVGSAGKPAAIEPYEIEAIQLATANASQIEPHPYLSCGDRVRIRFGSLRGLEGILIRMKNQYRLIISVTMLGKSAAVEVDGRDVERVGVTTGPSLAWRPMPVDGICNGYNRRSQ